MGSAGSTPAAYFRRIITMPLISFSFRRLMAVVLAGVLAATLGACGLVPKEPIIQQPMTARPPLPSTTAQ